MAALAQAVERHSGCGSQFVGNHRALVGNQRLRLVGVDQGNAAGAQDTHDVRHLFGGFLVSPGAGKLAERVFRDVVLGRAKAAGDDNYIGVVQAVAEFAENAGAVVADRSHIFHLNAQQVEFAGNV